MTLSGGHAHNLLNWTLFHMIIYHVKKIVVCTYR